MLRFLPPAGTELKASQILSALKSAVSHNPGLEEGLASVAQHLGVRHVFGTCSGRGALWVILESLRRLQPERSLVALPAYTCFSVPAAVVRAGLQIIPVDIDPLTFDFDFAQLEALPEQQLLCVVTSNLFGLVNDVPRICQIAREKGAFVIDDAAQALGAKRNGRLAGTLGDVGFYSLGRGKAIGLAQGGIISTNSEQIALAIKGELTRLSSLSYGDEFSIFLKLASLSILLNPRLYWIPDSLPFLKLGSTQFDPAFSTTVLSRLSLALLASLIQGLNGINQIRRYNAQLLSESLVGNTHFTSPKPALDSEPTYIRFPVLAKDAATRSQFLSLLRQAGLGGSAFYPSAICDIPGIQSHMASAIFHRRSSEGLSRRLLTLPTHSYVRPTDLQSIRALLCDLPAKRALGTAPSNSMNETVEARD